MKQLHYYAYYVTLINVVKFSLPQQRSKQNTLHLYIVRIVVNKHNPHIACATKTSI